jgi:hypothetical protein
MKGKLNRNPFVLKNSRFRVLKTVCLIFIFALAVYEMIWHAQIDHRPLQQDKKREKEL